MSREVDIENAPFKVYAGNKTEIGLEYCQEFAHLYTNNKDLKTLKIEILDIIKEIKEEYGIVDYQLVWGWPLDTDAHIHLMLLLNKEDPTGKIHDLINNLNNIFPKGQDYVEVRYKK